MKKKLAILLSSLVLIFSMVGCAYSEMDTTYDKEAEVLPPSMFVEVERGDNYRIIYQKETKVMYAVSEDSYGEGVFTLLIDENGDPMLYEGE